MSLLPPTHATTWLADPAWLAMDATARGMHTQLMLIAAQAPVPGVLADDENLWRRWLGIPGSKRAAAVATASSFVDALPAALLATLEEAFAQEDRWQTPAAQAKLLSHTWDTRWKPMLDRAWPRIEKEMVAQHPHLQPHLHQRYNALSAGLALGTQTAAHTSDQASVLAGARVEATAMPTTKKVRRKALPAIDLTMPMEQLADVYGVHGEATMLLNFDLSAWRDPAALLPKWRVPVSSQRRRMLWDVGVTLLMRKPGEEAGIRIFIGKLCREFGEDRVAAAIGDLSVRQTVPADPKSFLRGILRRQTEGSEAAQQARTHRASVPL